jgi:hypothetical protein
VTCERGKTFLDTFTFSNPKVTGDVSPGLSPLNRKRCLVKVTVIGQPPVTPIYCSLAFGFWASTNCAITSVLISPKMFLVALKKMDKSHRKN